MVNIKLNIPLKSVPGDYFCFLEGHPVKDNESGQTTIGIAAASKLYFTIAPSNVFEAFYYRILSLWKQGLPYTNFVGGSLLVFLVLRILTRFVKLNISLKKRESENKKENNE